MEFKIDFPGPVLRVGLWQMAKEMAVFKTLLPWFSAIVVLHVVGRRSLSSIPDKAIVNKFAQIDSLLITADPEPIEITDAAAFQRLRQLYEQGNWKPFIDTMPSDVVAIPNQYFLDVNQWQWFRILPAKQDKHQD